jgi:hypothetical protein
MSKRAIWDLAAIVAGIVYLELVLFQQIEFPLFGLWLVVVSGHELIGSRRQRRKVLGRCVSPEAILQGPPRNSCPERLTRATAHELITPLRTA